MRLFDYGHSKFIPDGKKKRLPPQVPEYSSPEVLRGKKTGCESDFWPYGVIMAELFQGWLPFKLDDKKTIKKLKNYELTPDLDGIKDKDAKRLIMDCLQDV